MARPTRPTESVLRTVEQALLLAPDRIALFGYAHVPWMKRHQTLLPEKAMPDAIQRVEQNTAAAAALLEAGYVQIGLDHFAKPSDPIVLRQREGRLHRNFQGYMTDEAATLIGFGTSAIDELARDGLVRRDGLSIAIPEDSRLLVRNVCAAFDRYLESGVARHSRAV